MIVLWTGFDMHEGFPSRFNVLSLKYGAVAFYVKGNICVGINRNTLKMVLFALLKGLGHELSKKVFFLFLFPNFNLEEENHRNNQC